jgi:hypothetical protein
MEETIYDLVRKAETNDQSGTTTISKYVNFDMRENIEKIDAYLNSKHISGELDDEGREKPFFNIVTAAVNIWYRATDIDRKNIRVRASKAKDIVLSFLGTVHLQEWMRKVNFGQFLNDWGRSLVRYGSSVVKFVEKDSELYAEVIPWNRIIVDPIDFENNPKVEVLELTPAQLRQREGYDKEIVEKLIETKVARESLNGQTRDNRTEYIKLYEVHGNLPLSFLTGKDKDDDTYVQQMHVISFIEGKGKGEYDDFTLVSGRESKDPYMITHLVKEDGRSMGIGAVEHLFEAQWMVNHNAKAIKDQLDLASKLFFQTSDGNYVGQNALSNIETGDILVHAANQPLTQVNNGSHDITQAQSMINMWKGLGQEIVSTPDALMGSNAPSGTAWRQVEALQQEAHSLFELFTENKGLAIEAMLREYVLPHLKKKLNSDKEVTATLDVYGIDKIDAIYIRNEAIRRENNRAIDQILSGEIAQPLDIAGQTMKIQGELSDLGGQRFYKPSEVDWKTEFKDFEWDVEVDVTGEAKDNQSTMATLTTLYQAVLGDPAQQATAKMILSKILEMTGAVSPIELQTLPQPQQLQPEALAGGGTPQVGALPVNQ